MPEAPLDSDAPVIDVDHKVVGDDEAMDADQEVVENEQARLREFVKGLSPDDIKSDGWFTKLIAGALGSYTEKGPGNIFRTSMRVSRQTQ